MPSVLQLQAEFGIAGATCQKVLAALKASGRSLPGRPDGRQADRPPTTKADCHTVALESGACLMLPAVAKYVPVMC